MAEYYTTGEAAKRMKTSLRTVQNIAEHGIIEPTVIKGVRQWSQYDMLDLAFWLTWPRERGRGSDFRRRALDLWRRSSRPLDCWMYETAISTAAAKIGDVDPPGIAHSIDELAAVLTEKRTGNLQWARIEIDVSIIFG